jgi:hypothetical protein
LALLTLHSWHVLERNKGETDAYPKRKNQSDCYHPERGLHPNRENRIGAKAFRYVDGIMALLSRIFKIAPWGAIRHIVQYNGAYVVRDNAASRMVRDIK